MTAVNRPLYVECGATFSLGFNWHRVQEPVTDPPVVGEPYDLTGCTAQMQFRVKVDSAVLVEATSDNQMIILGGPDGRVDVIIPGSVTESIPGIKKALYDLEIVLAFPLSSGEPDIRRLMEGQVNFSPNITKEVTA